MGFVKYWLDVKSGLSLKDKQVFYIDDNESIEKIEIIDNDNRWEVIFYIKNITDDKEAIEITKEIMGNLQNVFSFHYNAVFGDLDLHSFCIKEQIQYILGGFVKLRSSIVVKDGVVKQIQQSLNDKDLTNKLNYNVYHKLYRESRKSDDPVSRFMFLYSILADLINGSQSKIDKYIKKVEPEVKLIKSTNPRYPDRFETEYTWLRNQVGHTNSESDFLKIRTEIKSKEDSFSSIVKKAIG
ncbi:methylamine utilization protein MauJ [Metabacillus fastidiosus]|uniref:methylamine utilization protein MauJ n=1 Tax=Metabacillus fastidiosus TaxID=1458 RepID=UPI003D2768E1